MQSFAIPLPDVNACEPRSDLSQKAQRRETNPLPIMGLQTVAVASYWFSLLSTLRDGAVMRDSAHDLRVIFLCPLSGWILALRPIRGTDRVRGAGRTQCHVERPQSDNRFRGGPGRPGPSRLFVPPHTGWSPSGLHFSCQLALANSGTKDEGKVSATPTNGRPWRPFPARRRAD